MRAPIGDRFLPVAQTALRVAAALTYFAHGAQKTFGWLGGMGPHGEPVPLMTRFGAAGVIEVVAGICLALGFGTRWFAFIASGEMAVAYFWIHSAGSGSIWWWTNHGETVLLYSFIWLVYAAWGAGPYSIDGMIGARRNPS